MKLMPPTILLEETIRSIQASVSRARLAWLVGIIVTFAYFGGIYNQRCGYIDRMIVRRDIVIAIVERDLATKTIPEIASGLSDFEVTEKQLEFFDLCRRGKVREGMSICDYYNKLKSPTMNDSIRQSLDTAMVGRLKGVQAEHEKNKYNLDLVAIPGTTIRVTSSDLGIVGTLALIIVGFWLLANLRSEQQALLRFLGAHKDGAGQWILDLKRIGFTDAEMRRAFEPISNAFVFAPSERNVLIDWFDTLSFLVPIIMTCVAALIDWMDLSNKGLWPWDWGRVFIGLFLVGIVAIAWGQCIVLNCTTRTVLRVWQKDIAAT